MCHLINWAHNLYLKKMSEWFSEWFDSTYYHILYKDRDDNEAHFFISNLMTYLGTSKGSKILDLACGKGRHSKYLESLGYSVVGLDLSKNSIDSAKSLSSNYLSFDVHDMRDKLPYAPYDVILNLFTSFGYFNNQDDDLQTLSNVSNALDVNGVFVFDFLNIEYLEKNLVKKETKIVDGIAFDLNRFIENGSLYKNITFEIEGNNYTFQERVDALKYQKFVDYFSKVGLEITAVFGDYQLTAFDNQRSKRLIILSKKKV